MGLLMIPIGGIILIELAWDIRSYAALCIATTSALFALHLAGGAEPIAGCIINLQSRFAGRLERLINTTFRDLVRQAITYRYIYSFVGVSGIAFEHWHSGKRSAAVFLLPAAGFRPGHCTIDDAAWNPRISHQSGGAAS